MIAYTLASRCPESAPINLTRISPPGPYVDGPHWPAIARTLASPLRESTPIDPTMIAPTWTMHPYHSSVIACTLASCPMESAPVDPPRIIPLGLQSKGHSLDATVPAQSGHAPPPRRPGARFHQSAVPAAGWSRPAIPLGPKSISHTLLLQSLRLSLDTDPPPPGTPKPQQGPPQRQNSHMLI